MRHSIVWARLCLGCGSSSGGGRRIGLSVVASVSPAPLWSTGSGVACARRCSFLFMTVAKDGGGGERWTWNDDGFDRGAKLPESRCREHGVVVHGAVGSARLALHEGV